MLLGRIHAGDLRRPEPIIDYKIIIAHSVASREQGANLRNWQRSSLDTAHRSMQILPCSSAPSLLRNGCQLQKRAVAKLHGLSHQLVLLAEDHFASTRLVVNQACAHLESEDMVDKIHSNRLIQCANSSRRAAIHPSAPRATRTAPSTFACPRVPH